MTAPGHTKLDAALRATAEGFHVFALREDGKLPAAHGWQNRASTDPDVIRAVWIENDPVLGVERIRDFNIGIRTGVPLPGGGYLFVFDIDTKDGKRGEESFQELCLVYGDEWARTRTVRTASGGRHLLFRSPTPVAGSVSKIARDIDIRGAGNLAAAAGSTIGGKPYVDLGGVILDAPKWLVESCGQPRARDRKSGQIASPLDDEGAIGRAIALLKDVEPAIEGAGGDQATFQLACKVKDLGISSPTCLDLMWAHWNARCSPPWTWEDLARKVENAFEYGRDAVGSKHPASDFGPVEGEPELDIPVQGGSSSARPTIRTAADLGTRSFPDLRFVVPRYLVEGLTLLAGRPKLGKSWLCLDASLAVAVGGQCLGESCEQGDVLVLALEDNDRRLHSRIATLLPFIDVKDWPRALHYSTAWPRGEAGITEIRAWLETAPNPRLVVVDVLAMFRNARTDRETQYDSDYRNIQALQRLAGEFGVAILVVTHVRKSRDDGDPFEKVSGTLGLSGGADTVLILDRTSTGTTLYGRGRELEEFETAVEFDRARCQWTALGDPAEVKLSTEKKAVRDTLRNLGPMSLKDIGAALRFDYGYTKVLLHRMLQAGDVKRVSRGLYAHPDAAPIPPPDTFETMCPREGG